MSRFTLVSAVGASVLAVGLTLLPAGAAHAAADFKGISATNCQPFLPTTYAQALFKDNAVYNPTDVNQRVICPVDKDAFTDWTSGMVTLTAYIRAGSKPGKVACTLYGGGPSFGSEQVAYTGTSSVVSPGNNGSVSITGIVDPAAGYVIEGWNVLCTLNSGMSLGGFFFGEDFDTDGDN
ncbi:MAG: hypothetical protein ABI538_00175 [Pseudoxanthomonas sp.]